MPLLGPARPGGGPDAERSELVEREHPVGEPLQDLLDSVELGVALGVALRHVGAPRVYARFGNMRAAKNVARVAVDAIRAQALRALFSHGWTTLRPIADRDDRVTVGDVNPQALFGRVAAAVHHGSAGTTTDATRAGAPQTVAPRMADQPYRAGPAAESNIAIARHGPTSPPGPCRPR
jgi:vancomycin aglycone glucosyltransferase